MVAKIKRLEKDQVDDNFIQIYYEHQYDRVSKLEEQRLSITNYVLTVSALAFTFGFQGFAQLTLINAVGLPLIIIFANLFAISYIKRSSQIIRVHETLANRILHDFSPASHAYKDAIRFPKKGFFGGRTMLQNWIHILLIAVALLPLSMYIFQLIR